MKTFADAVSLTLCFDVYGTMPFLPITQSLWYIITTYPELVIDSSFEIRRLWLLWDQQIFHAP